MVISIVYSQLSTYLKLTSINVVYFILLLEGRSSIANAELNQLITE